MRSRIGRSAGALVVAMALVTGACGSDERSGEAQGPRAGEPTAPEEAPVAPETPEGAPEGAPEETAPADAEGAAPEASGSPGSAPATPGAGSASGEARADAPARRPAASGKPGDRPAAKPNDRTAAAASPSGGASTGGAESQGAPGAPPTPGVPPAPAGDTTPFTIGSIGTLSGPAGSIIKQTAEGVQVWVTWVNARGGVGGRQIKFIMADDGGDPARYRAELQRLVESENVVALVGNPDALTGSAGVDYVTSKGVPYIGGDGGGDWFYQSPMYFPQGTVGYTLAEAELRDAALYAREKNKKKFGTVTCTEADFCRVADRIWNDQAAKVGLEPVYRGRTSLVQPDFTAECLAAQRAGAEILEVALDSNSIRRLASSCARQGYKPLLGWPAGIAKDDQKKEPSLEGARVTIFTFPWTQGDTPATAEFQEAMKKYGKQLAPFTAGHSGGWTAAKMLEKAVTAIPGKVTREGVLAGLWAFRDETLGGLTSPRTFAKGENAPRSRCWLTIVIEDGQFKTQRGGKFICQ